MRADRAARAAALAAALLAALAFAPAQSPPPPLVLVSIDGFRADYLSLGLTPNIGALGGRGVRARWLTPSFPSITFPNHYTLVTGLLPEHHGIVANTMFDHSDGARFEIHDTLAVRNSRWWGGEPVWVTAVRQGRKSAAYFWPGSEAAIEGTRPTWYETYDTRVPDSVRVAGVLRWLAQPAGDRPAVVTLYFSGVDQAGHADGPGSPQVLAAIAHVDTMVGRLVAGIADQGLAGQVNVVVVSDHGMANISASREVFLDDYVAPASLEITSLGAFVAMAPRDGDVAGLLRALRGAPHVRLFARDSTPAAWRYAGNPRIEAVVGVADPGWTFTTHGTARAAWRTEGGNHGYDPADSTMRALFVAAGPSFRSGVVTAPFGNIHVYDLLCAALRLTPAPNDGSLDSVRALLR